MFLSSILAATFTFTATATGIEKGTSVEFLFVGPESDRDYESLFMLDESADDFCRRLEKAGIPRGKPVDPSCCRLWPVGCAVCIQPAVSNFVSGTLPEPFENTPFIYTGGVRNQRGSCEANEEMPRSICSMYSLAQSPIVFNGIFDQGSVYGRFTALKSLKKGEKHTFSLVWDEKSFPRHFDIKAISGKGADLIRQLKDLSFGGDIDVTISFDEQMSVKEAAAIANAVSVVDSSRIKINGCSNVFYRAFLPLIKWRDRKERLLQPFELKLVDSGDSDKLVYIEEDWSVEGDDPKLTPRLISFEETKKYSKTETCFVYARATDSVRRICEAKRRVGNPGIRNWYVFFDE